MTKLIAKITLRNRGVSPALIQQAVDTAARTGHWTSPSGKVVLTRYDSGMYRVQGDERNA